MNTFIKNFLNEEDGAVTVDWVVLTAAVVGLGVAGVAAVKGGVDGLASSIGTQMTGATVVTLGELGQADTLTDAGGAAAGGEEEAGRARRESKQYNKKKIAEQSRKLATVLSKKK